MRRLGCVDGEVEGEVGMKPDYIGGKGEDVSEHGTRFSMRMRCFWIRWIDDGMDGGRPEWYVGNVSGEKTGGMTTGRLQSSNVAEGSQNRVLPSRR